MSPLLSADIFHWDCCVNWNMVYWGGGKIPVKSYAFFNRPTFNVTNYTVISGGGNEKKREGHREIVRHNWRAGTVGLRYDGHYSSGSFGQVEDMEVIHSGTWPHTHTHTLTCQAAKATSIGGRNTATKGKRRAVLGCGAFSNVICTTERYKQCWLQLWSPANMGVILNSASRPPLCHI